MSIELPKDLEDSVRAEVLSGQFASEEALIVEAVRQLLQGETRRPASPAATPRDPGLGSIGAMRDSADELDEIVADAMRKRRGETWRDVSLE